MKKRIEIIDFWRGMVIIFMVIYHLLYDLKYMFNSEINWFSTESWYPFQQLICWSFIFISGFSVNLSRNPLKNALRVIFCAYLLTFVTRIAAPDFAIYFGVLHLIGFSMLIASFFKDQPKYPLLLAIFSFLIFFIFWKIDLSSFEIFYRLREFNLYPLGFYGPEFSSSDYFPMIPWFFLFITGYFFGNYHKNTNPFLLKLDFKSGIIGKMGRHSLLIYMLHQPVIYGILCLYNR